MRNIDFGSMSDKELSELVCVVVNKHNERADNGN